ncbi:MAG: alpha-galactosidase, partial [Alphaproteobacteria bacterium]
LSIQKGFAQFFPLEVMGSHVGPATCHITGRRLAMETRAGVALFGHMGVEVDLRQESDADKATLRAAIALYKAQRALIHSGTVVRFDTAPEIDAFAVIAADRSAALVSCALVASPRAALPGLLRFSGLDCDRLYRMRQVWPTASDTMTVSGDVLMAAGWTLPRLQPQSLIVLELQATD